MKPRCEALAEQRTYAPAGRCEKKNNVQDVMVPEGARSVRAKMCRTHRRMLEGKRPVRIAR